MIESNTQTQEYYLFHAIKGEFLKEMQDSKNAIASLEKAVKLTNNQAEIAHLDKKLAGLQSLQS